MRQLFVLDPLQQINPLKDSSAALMQAAQRAGDEVWACTPADLIARGDEPLAMALRLPRNHGSRLVPVNVSASQGLT